MIILGVICLLLGFFLGIQVLWIIGIVLIALGLILTLAGALGHAIGGRKTYY